MNVVNTRTNILIFMVVTQEPTIGKCQLLLMTCYSCLPHILETFIIKIHHQSKPKFECQRFFRRSKHGCMRTCNKLSWGACWDSEMSYFHPPFPSLFLTFHRPIKPSSYHFHKYIWVSHYYFPLYSF